MSNRPSLALTVLPSMDELLDTNDPDMMDLYDILLDMDTIVFYTNSDGKNIYVLEHSCSRVFPAVRFDSDGEAIFAVGPSGYLINQYDSGLSFMVVDTMKTNYIYMIALVIISVS